MNTSDSGAVMTAQKNFWNMSKEEKEERMSKVAHKAQQEIHDKGLPYIIGDAKGDGMYAIYPDGRKIFKPYNGKIDEGR
jgi:transcription initiation factor TFIIIB Brf1 subunit/transcription initiation factor TFIIB